MPRTQPGVSQAASRASGGRRGLDICAGCGRAGRVRETAGTGDGSPREAGWRLLNVAWLVQAPPHVGHDAAAQACTEVMARIVVLKKLITDKY